MAALHMKEELKYATMDSGVQCVMIAGMEMMLELFASSLDFLHGVRYYHNNVIIIIAIIMIVLYCIPYSTKFSLDKNFAQYSYFVLKQNFR